MFCTDTIWVICWASFSWSTVISDSPMWRILPSFFSLS